MIPDSTAVVPTLEDSVPARPLSPSILAITAGIIILIGTGAWVAGIQYGKLKNQQIVSELTNAQAQSIELSGRLHEQDAQIRHLNDAIKLAGTEKLAAHAEEMRRQILRLQAELSDLQSAGDRDRTTQTANQQILNTLLEPGVRFVPLRGLESAAAAVAYAFIAENRKLTLIVSNLPKAPQGRNYELWLTRKQDPTVVDAGPVIPDDDARALLEYSNSEMISTISELTITEEAADGNTTPSGSKLFTSAEAE
jgi:hypothetical protein